MKGYVKAHRKRFKNPMFEGEKWCRGYCFDWMVAQASYRARQKEIGGKIVTLQRGQFVTSVRFMADVWGWSKSAVDRFLTRLKTGTGDGPMIETQSGTGQLVITICNYERYQADSDEGGTPSGTDCGTPSGTAAGQQRDKLEEGLKKGEEEKKNIPRPFDEISQAVQDFNAVAESVGWSRVQKMSKARSVKLAARLKDCGGVDGWNAALTKASRSRFLTGQTDKPFFASFDWLITASSFTKLMEGNYDDRFDNAKRPGLADTIAVAARLGEAQELDWYTG